jgi:hypothetical protein
LIAWSCRGNEANTQPLRAALSQAIKELETIQRSTDAKAAPRSPESNERELGKQAGNNPGADTNPPEDQEDAVESVEVACQLTRQERVILQNETT